MCVYLYVDMHILMGRRRLLLMMDYHVEKANICDHSRDVIHLSEGLILIYNVFSLYFILKTTLQD